VHLVGLSIEHLHYQDVRNHEHQINIYIYIYINQSGEELVGKTVCVGLPESAVLAFARRYVLGGQ
jgi:hypothetical protein